MAIPHIGTYANAEQRRQRIPLIINIKGFRVGFLNYTYGTNGIEIQSDVVVDYIDREKIADDIAKTRKAGAEIVCVAVHWGDEYKLLPNASQKNLAQWLCDKGVDIIFGGHPHVIQPMMLVDNKVTGKKTALFYSLGNFISNMKTRDTRGGAISRVTLRRDSLGTAHVADLTYDLVFTVPPINSEDTFILYPADSVTSAAFPSWIAGNRNAFVSTATSVFNAHNVDVPRHNQSSQKHTKQ